jgi:hypothetical protein
MTEKKSSSSPLGDLAGGTVRSMNVYVLSERWGYDGGGEKALQVISIEGDCNLLYYLMQSPAVPITEQSRCAYYIKSRSSDDRWSFCRAEGRPHLVTRTFQDNETYMVALCQGFEVSVCLRRPPTCSPRTEGALLFEGA